MEEKKIQVTREGLKEMEDRLHFLKHTKKDEVAQKIKVAREQGDLSENAEYDAAKDEERDVAAEIAKLENILKNVEVVEVVKKSNKVQFGSKVTLLDIEVNEEITYKIKGSTEADTLTGSISNESPLGMALMGHKKGDVVEVEAPMGMIQYKIVELSNKE